jgi:hypothetical protein
MLEQMLESFLGTDHGRDAQQTLQQQGVPQSGMQQILSEALAAHQSGAPQASNGLVGAVMPFVSRFVREHFGGGQPQNGAPRANTPEAQAKFDANRAAKGGAMRGNTPEAQQKLDANRKAKGLEPQPSGKPQAFGKQNDGGAPQKQNEGFYPQKQGGGDYGNGKPIAKGYPQK